MAAGQPVLQAADRADLVALNAAGLPASAVAIVAGYRTAGDGGGGVFVWTPQDTAPGDDVLSFRSSTSPGIWKRSWSGGVLSPEMAGAVGDGHADDAPAFNRLITVSRSVGAFTIRMSAGRTYYLHQTLDLSLGAPGLTLQGPAAPRSFAIPNRLFPAARVELDPSTGATIKLGDAQTLRDVLIWRYGLVEAPETLPELRQAVDQWRSENGQGRPLSVGVISPFSDVNIEHVTIVGFHTGIMVSGARFKVRHCLIDAAGYAMDIGGSKDTSLIEDVQVRGLWAIGLSGHDELGDHSYRPGTAFYVHGGSDGLQLNSVMSIGWVTGIWLDGAPGRDDWLISLFQPNVETPANGGLPTAAIRTTGEVRRLTIIDPRIAFGGLGDGPSSGLEFLHNDPNVSAAANNNVTVIGGVIEVGNKRGYAVVLGPGSTGAIIDTTLVSNGVTPLVRILPGAGHWEFRDPQIRGTDKPLWSTADAQGAPKVLLNGVVAARSGSVPW
jgi:hypothetical protein